MHWLRRIGGVTVAIASVGWGVVINAAPAGATSAAPQEACFSPPIATGTGAGATALVAGDFFNHHNGTLDVVTGNSGRFGTGPGTISVLKGKGDGTFKPVQNVPASGPTYVVFAGDINDDGKLDLAYGETMYNTVAALWGRGNGLCPINTRARRTYLARFLDHLRRCRPGCTARGSAP